MAEKPVIKLENISKSYNVYKSNRQKVAHAILGLKKGVTFKALDNVDIEIHKGENVGILGNVGSGRTTLAKIISGISFPTEGKAKINGKVMAVFDLRSGFDLNFTGRDNIRVKGHMMGWTKKQIEEREDEIIDFAEMRKIIDLKMSGYKPVDRSRLGLSMALMDDADIIMYDGYVAVGTPNQRAKCIEKMHKWKEDKNRTLIMISAIFHTMDQLCDRGIVIDNGEIKFDGPFDEAVKIFRTKYKLKGKTDKNSFEEDKDNNTDEHITDDDDGSNYGDF
ncbi:MAG: ATP-binding cassette domain-containing protein [Bacillota bacterium]|nr:ATP-binding cassette domain-containing protein [Bacillota bacterium]